MKHLTIERGADRNPGVYHHGVRLIEREAQEFAEAYVRQTVDLHAPGWSPEERAA